MSDKELKGRVAILGPYRISANGLRYKVQTMGKPDKSNHFYDENSDKNHLVVKDEAYYQTFEGMCKGVLEKHMKRKFQVSGLQGLYTEALGGLLDMIEEQTGKHTNE